MKKIGIVGGVSWLSTVEYYSEICRRSEKSRVATPEMTIESLDIHKAVSYLGADDDEESWSRFDEYHRAALKRLAASGADFALIASNTPHHRFDSIIRGVGIPVINLFEVTAQECARIGATRVLILGTNVTMQSRTLRAEFSKHGIEAAGPDGEAARALTTALIADLQLGKLDGARERLAGIARNAPAVCLACTELPLPFPQQKSLASFESAAVVYINTTIAHVEAALKRAMR